MDKARKEDILLFIIKKEIRIDSPAAAAINKKGIRIKLLIQIPRLIKTASQAKGEFMLFYVAIVRLNPCPPLAEAIQTPYTGFYSAAGTTGTSGGLFSAGGIKTSL
jgi:hypothetical protein